MKKNGNGGEHTGNALDSEIEKTTTLTVTLPTQYKTLFAQIHHLPGNQTTNTIIVTNITIETLTDTQVLDASGQGNHSQIQWAVSTEKDTRVGTAAVFNEGYIKRKALPCIGVGKQWTHSRWIKIPPSGHDAAKNYRLWGYSLHDLLMLDYKENGGVFKEAVLMTSKYQVSQVYMTFPASSLVDNTWHHLVVMTDLQETYCRKIVYLDKIKIGETTVYKDFSTSSQPIWASDGFHYDMTFISIDNANLKASLANLIFFDRLLTEQEILWLYHNPQYLIRNYTKTDHEIQKLKEQLAATVP